MPSSRTKDLVTDALKCVAAVAVAGALRRARVLANV